MGYTHYWTRIPELPSKKFAAAIRDCKKLMPLLNVPLGGSNGCGTPVFRADEIAFNGRAPEDYESFVVERTVKPREGEQRIFEFCKTNQRPYDLCVQAALIVLKHHLGAAINVSSDGEESDWKLAREKCQAQLGYGEEFLLET